MKYEYIVTYGDYYKIKSFRGYVPLKLDHIEVLNGKVYYNSPKTLRIETTLLYDVGQKVSIGGYLINRRNFNLIELSITDNPVLDKAEIIQRKVIE